MSEYLNAIIGITAGVLFIAIGWPLMRGRIAPNIWYGFRIRSTLRDPEIWYAVNARGGRDLVIDGAATLALGLVALVFHGTGTGQDILLIAIIVVLSGGSLLAAWRGYALAREMDRRKHDSTEEED